MCPLERAGARAASRYRLVSARRGKRGVTKSHLTKMLAGRACKCLAERCRRSDELAGLMHRAAITTGRRERKRAIEAMASAAQHTEYLKLSSRPA
jgi:hypothetical protein